MADTKAAIIAQALAAKVATGKTFDEIALACGLTNVYAANLFYLQAQLKPATAEKLKKAVPGLSDEILAEMKKCPGRCFKGDLIQDPLVYR